jgi:hypothetical protein
VRLKAIPFNTEAFWDYVFSLPAEERKRILKEIPIDWNETNQFVYVEKEITNEK